ncbi:GHKL domain-containing protein [Anaerobacterium chartisolvens]|uniref:GHKL domain-containing protein n=1 Tax=Anaerobacterium chartisolvens TaxID=1297424 RepID=A0A369BG50_9FIRM|nr:GHKL domain-containing protein [Anaerobacterium chartisolvens]RCX19447.1 GHKL domain-containing protein [Anaerobacterium chartisolvens]
MTDVISDVVRSAVTNLCILSLLFSVAQPKYSKRFSLLALTALFLADAMLNIGFYRTGNYTAVVYGSVLLSVPVMFLFKLLFKETFAQWCFNVVTAMNVFAVVLVLSYWLSRPLPAPQYGNTVIRLLLFAAALFLCYRFLRPLYRQVMEQWKAYFLAAISILVCFFYVLVKDSNVEQALQENAGTLLVLCVMALCVYGSIFSSLKMISGKHALREENLRMKAEDDLLRSSANAMEHRLALMDEADRAASIRRHDQRHFDAALLELLQEGKSEEAMRLLQRHTSATPERAKTYCKNQAVNAIVGYYIAMAEDSDIRCDISLDIPADCEADSLELAMALSNLLENAIHANKQLPKEKRFLRCTATFAGQLLIGVENACLQDTALGENGLPIPTADGHGIGTKSVTAFVSRCSGEIGYKVDRGVFRVRIML